MRTGSVGNRNVEDMINTLPEPKKKAIYSLRKILLDHGYLEDAEYDAINVEPVLIYSKSEKNVLVLRHKWELSATILVPDPEKLKEDNDTMDMSLHDSLVIDEDGKHWLKFSLPKEESMILRVLEDLS